jgi:uncharacterized iron-regulated membrane protein
MTRSFFVWLHRWVGLTTAGFLVVAALTGSLLAYNTELERVFAPQLFARPHSGVPPLDLAALAEQAQTIVGRSRAIFVLYAEPDQTLVSVAPPIDPVTRQPLEASFDQLFLDPWTCAELGRRKRGDISEGPINFMPFIYKLHWTLTFKNVGSTILGVVAIMWSVDCFIAFYLTLPTTPHNFWRRWTTAWKIKRAAGFYRLNFDLHRSSGLWLWPLLFVFAWSSVMFNIRPAYEWVTEKLFDYRSRQVDAMLLVSRPPNDAPSLDWRAAQATGERLIAESAARDGFVVKQALGLGYNPRNGFYTYEVRSSRDVFERSPKGGGTTVAFDGGTGELLRLHVPTGQHAGNTVESWLYALHMARVFGPLYQIFVCLLGLVVTMLSITGVYIWWKKRAARKFHVRAARAQGIRPLRGIFGASFAKTANSPPQRWSDSRGEER